MIKYYYEQKDKKELQTKIIDVFEENGKCFIWLEDRIFYPQGGGQKGDHGCLIIEKKNIILLILLKMKNIIVF